MKHSKTRLDKTWGSLILKSLKYRIFLSLDNKYYLFGRGKVNKMTGMLSHRLSHFSIDNCAMRFGKWGRGD